jgi:hypothetical protein
MIATTTSVDTGVATEWSMCNQPQFSFVLQRLNIGCTYTFDREGGQQVEPYDSLQNLRAGKGIPSQSYSFFS